MLAPSPNAPHPARPFRFATRARHPLPAIARVLLATLSPPERASLRAFTPVFDGLWTRVNALMAGRGKGLRSVRCVYRAAFNSLKLVRCCPCASKFAGASQRSKAALRAGHSLSSME
jgi:hypothetical protein